VLIILAIVALIALLVVAYKKFEGFRNVVDTVFGFIKKGIGYLVDIFKKQFDIMYGLFKTIFNGIAKLWNNTIGKLSFSIPSWVPVIGGAKFEVPDMPYLANGGIVTGPTVAMIGEAGPEAVIPLDRMKNFGMGGGINITVQTGVGDPVAIGKAVSDVLDAYQRRTGKMAA
jgi:hypothetical protein